MLKTPPSLSLKAKPLRKQDFAAFGDVIDADIGTGLPVNGGWAKRFDGLAALEHETAARLPSLALYRADPRTLPFHADELECHPASAQVFLPMTVASYLVVTAPADEHGEPDLGGARAFLAHAGQGICYRAGIWHLPITALDRGGDFAMLMWEDRLPRDCLIRRLPAPLLITA